VIIADESDYDDISLFISKINKRQTQMLKKEKEKENNRKHQKTNHVEKKEGTENTKTNHTLTLTITRNEISIEE